MSIETAENIRTMDVKFKSRCTKDGLNIGMEYLAAAVYNLEKISTEGVKQALLSGEYTYDENILMVDMHRIGNIFPHKYDLENAFVVELPDNTRPEWNQLKDWY